MSVNREKTSRVMGFVVSILLHGIFFAGCLALDLSDAKTNTNADSTEINQITDQSNSEKSKS